MRPRPDALRIYRLRSLGVPGICLVGAGIGFTVAPFVFLGLGNYQFFAIFIAGVLVGPYFLFVGYVVLWGAFFNTDPPYVQQLARPFAWFARTTMRKL